MDYIRADDSHVQAVVRLALMLWHDNTDDLAAEFTEVLHDRNSAVFLCMDNGFEAGFAQFSLRNDYVEGTDTRPVGYLEAVYVREEYRRTGVARQLIRMGEIWTKDKGCTQLASDCELSNIQSLAFHLGCGFSEANRIICFVKNIDIGPGSIE